MFPSCKSAVGWIEVSLLEMKKGDEVMIDKNGAKCGLRLIFFFFWHVGV